MITRKRLAELLHYDVETGFFYWQINRKGGAKAGTKAGHTTKPGYCLIGLDGTLYKAHRLAWLYMYDELPTADIDHINQKPDDNRITNLRLTTQLNNQQNRKINRNNSSGYRGVSYIKARNKWIAQKQLNGQYHHLGYFDNPEDASAAYNDFLLSNPNEFYPTT